MLFQLLEHAGELLVERFDLQGIVQQVATNLRPIGQKRRNFRVL